MNNTILRFIQLPGVAALHIILVLKLCLILDSNFTKRQFEHFSQLHLCLYFFDAAYYHFQTRKQTKIWFKLVLILLNLESKNV